MCIRDRIAGVDYRKQIETQRGAVIATELKNNANKLAKWTCCALLAGADIMKLGFVSRAHPKDPANHVILNTQSYKPKDFAQQINLTETNMWGVFKAVADATMKLPDGKYLLVKDPNKPTLRTYEVPEQINWDYGEPQGLCKETGDNTGVFTREWSKATITMDCNTWTPTIAMKHEVSSKSN